MLEVRDQLGVPRLDETAGREVLDPADVGPEQVRLQAGMKLRQRVGLVPHDGELGLVVRVLLHVRGEHGLPAVVAVARPVENLQPSRLRAQRVERGLRCAEPRRQQAGAAGGGDLEQPLPTQPLCFLVVAHLGSSFSP